MTLAKKVTSIVLGICVLLSVFSFPVSAEELVQMYALDGTSYMINESEVEAYKAVGLYASLAEVQTAIYAPDGRCAVVFKAEAEAYVNQGWYYVPVTVMYAADGTEYVIAKSEVEAYKAVGLSLVKPEYVTLYSPVGEIEQVLTNNVPGFLSCGYSYTMPLTYIQTDVPNFAAVTNVGLSYYTEIDGGLIFYYNYDYASVEAYKTYLLNNGWHLEYYENGFYNYVKGNALACFTIQDNMTEIVMLYDYIYEMYYPGTYIPDYSIVTGQPCLGCQAVSDTATGHPHFLNESELAYYDAYLVQNGWTMVLKEIPESGVQTVAYQNSYGEVVIEYIDRMLGYVIVVVE